jgi:CRISPR/Cas system type I-B associated protein Csh2 (Cas7 group RAMP superfamily)
MIIAKQYIQTGFSAEDAEKLSVAIQPLFEIHNLSEIGEATYQYSLENAKEISAGQKT